MRRSNEKILATHIGSLRILWCSIRRRRITTQSLPPSSPSGPAARRRARHHQRGRVRQIRRLAALRGKPARLAASRARPHPLCLRRERPRGVRRFLQIRDRTGDAVLSAERGLSRGASFFACTGPITYRGQARWGARSRCFARRGRVSAAGRLSHHHGAGEPRALSQERVLQERGGIRLRDRRGDAHRVRDDRRAPVPAAGG